MSDPMNVRLALVSRLSREEVCATAKVKRYSQNEEREPKYGLGNLAYP